jgi:hypothetical protein
MLNRAFTWKLLLLVFSFGFGWGAIHAQVQEDLGSCTLRDHIYTCDGAAFQKALANATTVNIKAHNSDGFARSELTKLITVKLRKTIAPQGSPADLVFLMIPIEPSGVTNNSNTALGTLRIYSSTAEGDPQHLLWAETYSGAQDVPWPMVAHGLITQFESHFHIR